LAQPQYRVSKDLPVRHPKVFLYNKHLKEFNKWQF
jgi:hypothetical protein